VPLGAWQNKAGSTAFQGKRWVRGVKPPQPPIRGAGQSRVAPAPWGVEGADHSRFQLRARRSSRLQAQ